MTETAKIGLWRILFYTVSTIFTIITMFYPISCRKQKEPASQQSVESLKAQQEELKRSVQHKLEILEKRSDSLRLQLKQTQTKLARQKLIHATNRDEVIGNLEMLNESDVPPPCDSLAQSVRIFMASDQQQDSLYEQNISELESIVQVKDSCLDVVQAALDESQSITDKSLVRQQQLENDVSKKEKQVKRLAVINKVLSGVILIGAATVLIIH